MHSADVLTRSDSIQSSIYEFTRPLPEACVCVCVQTDRQTDRSTRPGIQTDRTDKQTNRQTD